MRTASILAASLLFAAPLLSQETPTPPEGERVHVVRPGDTLWDIARTYLNDPFLWPELFRLNADVVRDPARIHPSERLRIPGAPGAPAVAAQDPARDPVRDLAGPVTDPDRTVFFRDLTVRDEGPGHTIRRAGTADVPVLTPGDFLRAGLLAAESEVRPVGVIAEVLSPTVVPRDMPPMVQTYDKVFVPLADAGSARVGDRLHFFRKERRIKPYGWVYASTGLGTVAAIDGQTATVVVVRLFDDVAPGDLALLASPSPVPPGVSPRRGTDLEGARIVAFEDPHPLQGRQDIVFLSVGEGSGVTAGDEFEAYLPPTRRRWGSRPEIPVARLQVLRVMDRTATARVMDLEYPALETGMPIRRVASMP